MAVGELVEAAVLRNSEQGVLSCLDDGPFLSGVPVSDMVALLEEQQEGLGEPVLVPQVEVVF